MVARDEIVIATKAGISRRTGTRVTDASRGSLLTALDGSLARLGVDHVDLWQVHTWVDDAPLEETLSALDTAVATGRASYVGVSNYSGWQTAQAATWQRAVPGRVAAGVDADGVLPAQPDDRGRGAARRPRPRPRASCRGPRSAAGCSTGKYRTGTPADSRAATSHFSGFVGAYLGPRSQQVVEAVARAAEGLGWTPLEVALAWVRDRPGVTAPIVGARTAAAAARCARGRGAHAARRDHGRPGRRLGAGGRRPPREASEHGRHPAPRTGPGVEWEFERITIARDYPRSVVTKMLVERAEHGGWELDRVRVAPDGTRRVVLRRKIIRVRPTLFSTSA